MGRIIFTESVKSVLFTEIRAAQAHNYGNIHGIQIKYGTRILSVLFLLNNTSLAQVWLSVDPFFWVADPAWPRNHVKNQKLKTNLIIINI